MVSETTPTTSPATAAPELTAAQRKKLRGLAHALEPVIRLGRQGFTESARSELERAIAHHELVKVKIAAEREERRRIVAAIGEQVPCALVGTVGGVAILYRPHQRPERRRIRI